MKGPANEGMAMNKARIGPGFLQPTAGAATLGRKSLQAGWCLPILCQGQPRKQQRNSD